MSISDWSSDVCSSDRTDGTILRIERSPNVRVLQLKKNAGQSAAMLVGMRAARGESIVLLAGDLQHDPRDIPKLLAEIERGADPVCSSEARRVGKECVSTCGSRW